MTKFVIAGIQRTGTTLIRTALDGHPDIRCVGEALLFTYGIPYIKRARGRGVDQSYRQYVGETWGNLVTDIFSRRSGVYAYLDTLYEMPGYRAIGFKLMLAQLRYFPMVMDYIREHDIRIIHVIRENVLKTHISRFRTKITGVAHSEQKIEQQKIRLQTKGLVDALRKINATNIEWESKYSGLQYMQISYESFVSNREIGNIKLLDYLGIDDKVKLESPYKKVTSNDLGDALENYEEVKTCLSGTEFESFLYE